MTSRPTPEEIASLDYDEAGTHPDHFMIAGHRLQCLASLRAHGYRIVHPDDVPVGRYMFTPTGFVDADGEDHREGWDACREYIFGDA